MVLDFNIIEEQSFPNFKGGEKSMEAHMYFDGKCRILKARLQPGATIGLHTHEANCEVIFLVKGNAHVLFDGEMLPLNEGQCHYCPMGHSHSLINDSEEEIQFLAVVPEQKL